MAWPQGMKLRTLTFGAAKSLADGQGLDMRITVTPHLPPQVTSGQLVWAATGDPLLPLAVSQPTGQDETGQIPLPATDQGSFTDGDGNAVDPGQDGHFFSYDIAVIATRSGSTVWQRSRKSVVLPLGDGSPVDFETMIAVTGSVGGVVVSVPDVWTQQIADLSAKIDAGGGGAAPQWGAIQGRPSVIAAGATADAARSVIGAVGAADDRLVRPSDSEELAFAVTDELGRASWIQADMAGLPTQETIDILAARIQASAPLAARPTGLTTIGDSLTMGGQGSTDVHWPTLVADRLGLPVWNPAVAGEAAFDAAFRSGALVPQVTVAGGQIGTGTDTVTITTITPTGKWGWRSGSSAGGQLGIFPGCRLCGVAGTLKHSQSDGSWTFTPDVSRGVAVPVPAGSPIRVTAGAAHRGDIWTIWIGRNDLDFGDIQNSVEPMRSFMDNPDRFLILSIPNSANEPSGSSGYQTVASLNAAIQAAWPDQYVDVRAWLVADGLQAVGLTPTAQDTTDIASDIIPTSLRADIVHLNLAGATALAGHLASIIDQKGWV